MSHQKWSCTWLIDIIPLSHVQDDVLVNDLAHDLWVQPIACGVLFNQILQSQVRESYVTVRESYATAYCMWSAIQSNPPISIWLAAARSCSPAAAMRNRKFEILVGGFFGPVLNICKTIFFRRFSLYWCVSSSSFRIQKSAKHPENTPRGPRTSDWRIRTLPVRRSADFWKMSVFSGGCGVLCAIVTNWQTAKISESQPLWPGNRRKMASRGRNLDQLTSGWNRTSRWRAAAPGLKPLRLPRADQWARGKVPLKRDIKSRAHWSLFNGTWTKRHRELDNWLTLEIGEMTPQMH